MQGLKEKSFLRVHSTDSHPVDPCTSVDHSYMAASLPQYDKKDFTTQPKELSTETASMFVDYRNELAACSGSFDNPSNEISLENEKLKVPPVQKKKKKKSAARRKKQMERLKKKGTLDKYMKGIRAKKLCRFVAAGRRCPKGADCQFSHMDKPNLKKKEKIMELCRAYARDICGRKDCRYLHNEFPCKHFHLGRECFFADFCRFSHARLTDETKRLLEEHMEHQATARQSVRVDTVPGMTVLKTETEAEAEPAAELPSSKPTKLNFYVDTMSSSASSSNSMKRTHSVCQVKDDVNVKSYNQHIADVAFVSTKCIPKEEPLLLRSAASASARNEIAPGITTRHHVSTDNSCSTNPVRIDWKQNLQLHEVSSSAENQKFFNMRENSVPEKGTIRQTAHRDNSQFLSVCDVNQNHGIVHEDMHKKSVHEDFASGNDTTHLSTSNNMSPSSQESQNTFVKNCTEIKKDTSQPGRKKTFLTLTQCDKLTKCDGKKEGTVQKQGKVFKNPEVQKQGVKQGKTSKTSAQTNSTAKSLIDALRNIPASERGKGVGPDSAIRKILEDLRERSKKSEKTEFYMWKEQFYKTKFPEKFARLMLNADK